MEGDQLEVRLSAPERFDEAIGYWTGEPDREALAEAVAAIPETEGVERRVEAGGLILSGPARDVLEEARRFRELGLV